MAYRRRQGISRASTFKEEIRHHASPPDDTINNNNNNNNNPSSSSSSSSSLAAQAIRASSAHRDSSLSSAYRESAFASNPSDHHRQKSFPASRSSVFHQSYQSPESSRKTDNPSLQKGLDAITSSLNYIGGTIGKSFEEGLTIVENRTADIIQETRKLHIRKKGGNLEGRTQVIDVSSPQQQVQMQTDQEMQLKASRDVAMAMTAKAKLLLRELKTVKADLAFAKERCNQLEEENKILRESREKGDRPEDDDLIRLQLETLLAEKARLAHENSIYARENRFLREIVEYHQLTMQDVVYLDEGIEEVTEVYPVTIPAATGMWPAPPSPPPPPMLSSAETNDISAFPTPRSVDTAISTAAKGTSTTPIPPPVGTALPPDAVQSSSTIPVSTPEI